MGYVRARIGGKTVLYHRYLMEQRLGRVLSKAEIVHHKNGDKKDNNISNLEIKNQPDHARDHALERLKKEWIELECSFCGNMFVAEGRRVRYKIKKGQIKHYCSRRCVGKSSMAASSNSRKALFQGANVGA